MRKICFFEEKLNIDWVGAGFEFNFTGEFGKLSELKTKEEMLLIVFHQLRYTTKKTTSPPFLVDLQSFFRTVFLQLFYFTHRFLRYIRLRFFQECRLEAIAS